MKNQRYKTISENELVVLFQQGDDAAFTEIYHRCKGALYMHALKMLNNREDARDIVQDVFCKLWNMRSSLRLNTSISAYLHTCVRNRIMDIFSHEKVSAKYITSLQSFIDQGSFTTDNFLREKELKAIIETEINALPEKMREVFILSRQNYLPHQKIAEDLNISEATVKKHITKALKRMRPHLDIVIIFISSLPGFLK